MLVHLGASSIVYSSMLFMRVLCVTALQVLGVDARNQLNGGCGRSGWLRAVYIVEWFGARKGRFVFVRPRYGASVAS